MIPDEAKRKQEIRSLLKNGDSFKKIVIASHAPAPLYDNHGILTMNSYDFLLNPTVWKSELEIQATPPIVVY